MPKATINAGAAMPMMQVGDFAIVKVDAETINIWHVSGEGGSFKLKDFKRVVEAFYAEYF